MSPYEVMPFAGFGRGLNLRDKADAINEEECIDALNVEFTERGAVKQRAGYAVFTATALDGQGDTLHPHYESDATKHLIVGDVATGQLTALNTSGAEVDIEAGLSNGGCFGFQRFGAPGTEYTYIGNGVDELWFYNGTAFSNVPDDGARVPPKGGALGLSPGQGGNTSNRLVNARFTTATGGPNGATTTPSTIWFSNPGDPTVWGDNNYLHLTPGDGESIQALVNWREFLFVFKETKFFVFTGETVSATGTPVFNYYTVDTGYGAVGPRAVTADDTGVYFASRKGVHRTTGGEPERVSELITPIFLGGAEDYFTGGVLDHSVANLIAVNAFDGRLYVNYSTAGTANDRTLVYDPTYEWWSLWDVAAADMCGFREGNREALFFTYPAGDNEVARFGDYTNDATAAIVSRWRSGWNDYGLPIVKTIRESKIWGSGVVKMAVSADFAQGTGTLTTMDMRDAEAATWGGTTWGGSTWSSGAARVPAGQRAHATRGTVFSTSLYNHTKNQEWIVARLDHHLRESRHPTVRKGVPA